MNQENKLLQFLPEIERRYIFDTASIVKNVLKNNLVGIYLFGSASYKEYIPGESDIDIQVVSKTKINTTTLEILVEKLLHSNHPCPATKLEFVAYESLTLSSENSISYSLNLNTGRTIADHFSLDSSEDAPHWFVLDIAMGKTNAITIYGIDAFDIFPKISKKKIAQSMFDCLNWFNLNLHLSEAHKFCIFRCFVFTDVGKLVSKKSAKKIIDEMYGAAFFHNEEKILKIQGYTLDKLKAYASI
jgi:predicted nucleotidyltransferase